MSKTDGFFREKKGWSLLKDEIVDHYLKPYIAKILCANRPLLIIDFFAGKGRFDDGTKGSPLIVAEHIKNVLENENPKAYKNKKVDGYFIEKKYGDELEKNLKEYNKCHVSKGTYEEHIKFLYEKDIINNISLFLYIDPYGIKNLDFEQFDKISQKGFSSIELLMNFNSFGFLREGCRVLKYEVIEPLDDEISKDEKKGIEQLNKIAGGDYWQSILDKYNSGVITMNKAEELFAFKYLEKLKKVFKYVVNIPIKEKAKNIAKYRLIFGSNHEDALILMVDQMNRTWKQFIKNENDGQSSIFDIMDDSLPEAKMFEFPDMTRFESFDIN